jgi:hypothetical protein
LKRTVTSRRRRLGQVALAVPAVLGGWVLTFAMVVAPGQSVSAATGPTDLGAPTFFDSTQSAVITGGGSATEFTLGLPSAPGSLGAACPGDTSNDGYQVWSYLTFDNGTNGGAPATLALSVSGGSFATPPAAYASEPPVPAAPLANFSGQGEAWGGPSDPEVTAVDTGLVINLPIFGFAPFYTGDFATSESAAVSQQQDLFPGTWDMGIACTKPGSPTPAVYWNAQVIFTASSTDPNGFTWKVAAASPPPTTTTTTSTTSTTLPSDTSSTTTSTIPGGTTTTTTTTVGTGTNTGSSGAGGSGDPGTGGTGTADPTLAATGAHVQREVAIGLLLLLVGVRLILVARRADHGGLSIGRSTGRHG